MTRTSPSLLPLRTMGLKSGFVGFSTISLWRHEQPFAVFSLSYRLTV